MRGGTACCVPGCSSHSMKNKNISFHFFPKDQKLFDIWITRINRRIAYGALGEDILWKPARYNKICGLHFNKSGKKNSTDKLPRFFPDRSYPKQAFQYQEPSNLNINGEVTSYELQNQQSVNNDNVMLDVNAGNSTDTRQACNSGNENIFHSYCLPVISHENCASIIKNLKFEIAELKEREGEHLSLIEKYQKNETVLLQKIIEYEQQLGERNKELLAATVKIEKLANTIESDKASLGLVSNMLANEKMLRFYTGFQNKERYTNFINFIKEPYGKMKHNNPGRPHKLTFEEEALMVFLRLRLGLLEQDLAYRFNIHQSTVGEITTFWLDFLNSVLGSLNVWPSKNIVSKYMPQIFKDTFPNTRIILDCAKVFIESPSGYVAKGLVGIAPLGHVSFASDLYPGHDSDKDIFLKSDLPSLLEPGDSVIVDKGVLITEELIMLGVELITPPFLLADSGQFSSEELEKTQKIASLRVHVERVISEIKNFRILKYAFPNADHNSMNKIWKICCYLQNFINDPILDRNT